jgi:hypothetical protein
LHDRAGVVVVKKRQVVRSNELVLLAIDWGRNVKLPEYDAIEERIYLSEPVVSSNRKEHC